MTRRAATLAAFNDPDGTRYGLPTFPWNGTWNLRPELATRRQLAARGLRPGGQQPAAQLMWRSRRARRTGGIRVALLYRVDLALPKREPTIGQLRALVAAHTARMTCRVDRGGCGRMCEFYIPTRWGVCPDCADPDEAIQSKAAVPIIVEAS